MALDYNDIICQAIDTIVSKRLEGLEYDQTITAIVVDDSDAMSGHYVVNDGSIDFDAYSEDTGYVNGDNVYVTVPRGDFTQTKVIISKYTKNNDTDPIAYQSPLDSVYVISDNLAAGDLLNNNSILANGRQNVIRSDQTNGIIPPGKYRIIWEKDLSSSNDYIVQNNAVFDTFIIQAGFKCALTSSYNVVKGNYGLIIELTSTTNNETANSGIQTRLYLDSKDMFGNPFGFATYMNQIKTFDITNLNTVSKITIYLYQGDNFEYRELGATQNSRLPSPWGGNGELDLDNSRNNIFVDNLSVFFGMNTANINDNTFKIYTSSSSSYDMTQSDPTYNQKTIIPIWFNKGEVNGKYIGYSDGVYDYTYIGEPELVGLDYDEDKYLELAKYYNSGSTIPLDTLAREKNIPTVLEIVQAYSSGQQIVTKLKQLQIYINNNIPNIIISTISDLRPYQTELQKRNCGEYRDTVLDTNDISSPYAELLIATEEICADESVNGSFMNTLLSVLEKYGLWFSGEANHGASKNGDPATISSAITSYENVFENFVPLVEEFFDDVDTQTPNGLQIYTNSWRDAANELLDKCRDLFVEIHELISYTDSISTDEDDEKEKLTIKYNLQKAYDDFSNGHFNDYEEQRQTFFDAYTNKYCIYWYRYVGENVSIDDVQLKDNFMPTGWERITNLNNYGLPKGYHQEDDDNLYFDVRPADARILMDVGDASLVEERIQAVLIYNHEIFKSNILTFYNDRPVLDDFAIDSTSGLYLQLTDEEKDDLGNITHQDTYYSKEAYQLYGITNYLVNQSEGVKRRTIRARFRTKTKTDEWLKNDCIIYWLFPVNATMLRYRRDELIEAGFSIYDPTYLRTAEDTNMSDFNEYYKKYLTDNNIAEADVDDDTYNEIWDRYKEFIVGVADPLPGEPYIKQYKEGYAMIWKKITSSTNQDGTTSLDPFSTMLFYYIKDYYIPSFTNNTIYCKVIKKDLYPYEAEQYFTFSSYGTSGTDYSLCIVPATKQTAVTNTTPLQLKIQVFDTNGQVMPEETSRVEVSWYQNIGQKDNQTLPSLIITGTAPDYYVKKLDGITYQYAVLQAKVTINIAEYQEAAGTSNQGASGYTDGLINSDKSRKPRNVDLIAYYPVPWARGDYYIEGATSVVYDSLGTNPQYYEGDYKLFHGRTDETYRDYFDKEAKYGIITQRNQHYYVDTEYFPSGGNMTTLAKEMLPKIKVLNPTVADNQQYDIDFASYRLSMPNMYLEPDKYCTVWLCAADNEAGTNRYSLFKQPILVIKNRYASPMLNNWDGELTIDEKNGTILATMIGAGIKESDNTFSGVLMGDVATTSQAVNGRGDQGIYGFHHSEQSFGFKNDGTGFIGKDGRGRIQFDGNSGQISSASYDTAGTGMKIDLDDGWIDMRGGYVDRSHNNNHSLGEDWDPGDPSTWDQNEVTGYDNLPHYTPTGSQVKISVNSPFLQVVSPSYLYYSDAYYKSDSTTANTLRQDTVNAFWASVDQELTEENMVTYLNDVLHVYNVTERYCRPATAKIVSTETSSNNISGTLPTQYYPFYVYIDENIPKSKINSTFQAKFKDGLQEVKNETISSETDASGNTEIVDPILLAKGDYIKVSEIAPNTIVYEYIAAKDAIGVTNMPEPSVQKVIVGNNNKVITTIDCDHGNNAYSVYTIDSAYTTVEALARAICNTAVPELPNAAMNNTQKAAFYQNLRVQFLTKAQLDQVEKFYIDLTGAKQHNTLLKVGTDEYYLQTDNYHRDSAPFINGKGLKFDLMNGSLDAYNFSLRAADTKTGSYIQLRSDGGPFFAIKYSGDNRSEYVKEQDSAGNKKYINLINITSNDYELNSQNWYHNASDKSEGSGTHFDMKKGEIISYNFNLQAIDSSGSYLQFKSNGNPWIQVHYKNEDDEDNLRDLDVFYISRSKFLLRSLDWQEKATGVIGKGTEINLTKGSIKSYNFNLRAENNTIDKTTGEQDRYFGSYLAMNSNGKQFLRIHSVDNDIFVKYSAKDGDGTYVLWTGDNVLTTITYYKKTGDNSYSKLPRVIEQMTSSDYMTNNSTSTNTITQLYVWQFNTFSSGERYFYLQQATGSFNANTTYYILTGPGCQIVDSPVEDDFSKYYIKYLTTSNNRQYYYEFRQYYKENQHVEVNVLDITNSTFYLRSQNYLANWSGIEFNLVSGTLRAYSGFTIDAKDLTDGSNNQGARIRLSTDGSPYLLIHHVDIANGRNLDVLKISKTEFFLRSMDWVGSGSNKSGIQLNLQNGTLVAYSGFTIDASDSNGRRIRLSTDGNPYFLIHHEATDQSVDIISISKTAFNIRSMNWISDSSTSTYQGIDINLTTGNLRAFQKFNIWALDSATGNEVQFSNIGSSSDKYLYIKDGSDNGHELVRFDKTYQFLRSLNWSSGSAGTEFNLHDGTFKSYQGFLQYGDARLDSDSNGFSRSMQNGWPASGWRFAIGTTFGVTTGGVLYATGAHFSGDITGSSITGSSFGTTNSSFYVSPEGAVTATNISISGTASFQGSITSSTITGGTLNIGPTSGSTYALHADNDGVTIRGGIYASYGQIGPYTIPSDGSSLSGNNVILSDSTVTIGGLVLNSAQSTSTSGTGRGYISHEGLLNINAAAAFLNCGFYIQNNVSAANVIARNSVYCDAIIGNAQGTDGGGNSTSGPIIVSGGLYRDSVTTDHVYITNGDLSGRYASSEHTHQLGLGYTLSTDANGYVKSQANISNLGYTVNPSNNNNGQATVS